MISRISSESLYTLLCVGSSWSTDSEWVWSKNWGSIRCVKISLPVMHMPIRQKRPNFRIPYFHPFKCRPAAVPPGAPFYVYIVLGMIFPDDWYKNLS